MSIIDNIQKRKITATTQEIDKLISQFIEIPAISISPINQNAEYGLKDFKENEKILKITDTTPTPIALLIDKKDLPLSKRICYLNDLDVKSNFSYIYSIDLNENGEKDYRLVSITEYEKAFQIAQVVEQCMNSFENKQEEQLLRCLQLYARNIVTESILKDTIKLLLICDKNNNVYLDGKSAAFSLKLLKDLRTDYKELPIKKFINIYNQKHTEITTKYVPAALDFLSKQIQTVNAQNTNSAQPNQSKSASIKLENDNGDTKINKAPTEQETVTYEKSEEIFSKIKNHAEAQKEPVESREQSHEKTA